MDPQPCAAELELHRFRVTVVLCRLILQTSAPWVRLKLHPPIFLEDLLTRICRRSWTSRVAAFLRRRILISIVRKFGAKTILTPMFRLCTIYIRKCHRVLRSSSNSEQAFSATERGTSTSYQWTYR